MTIMKLRCWWMIWILCVMWKWNEQWVQFMSEGTHGKRMDILSFCELYSWKEFNFYFTISFLLISIDNIFNSIFLFYYFKITFFIKWKFASGRHHKIMQKNIKIQRSNNSGNDIRVWSTSWVRIVQLQDISKRGNYLTSKQLKQ